jgi:transcriptional antiterminator NusG
VTQGFEESVDEALETTDSSVDAPATDEDVPATTPEASADDVAATEPLVDGAAAEDESVDGDAAVDETAVDGDAAEDEPLVDGAAAEDEQDAPIADALAEFRERLHNQVGDWYVVHTYSGMEKRVKANLENRMVSLNAEDYIFEIVVPTEEVAEIKNGQRKLVKRTVLPGYVLVRMDLTDESWGVVRHTPSVTGFVGNSHQPVPLSLAAVESMHAPAVEA